MIILCLKIFSVRIIDVSLGTIRTIITVKGKNLLASIVGFFEIFIWFVVVQEALTTDNTSIFIAISYASGFATGTFIGGIISEKIIQTNLTVQIVSTKSVKLIEQLRKNNYAVTILNMDINNLDKQMLILEINSKNLNEIRKITREIDNKAFVFVNETKYVFNGYQIN